MIKKLAYLILLTLVSCGGSDNAPDGSVVLSRMELTLIPFSVLATSGSATFSTSQFIIPTISSTVLSFGSISITALSATNLNVCGNNGTKKCTSAVIRVYTTGVAGAGLYNATEGYGAPLRAGQNTTLVTVGLGVINAAIVQSITLASNKTSLSLSDFLNPKYNVQADFSNAGAGSYTTNLVFEFALLP